MIAGQLLILGPAMILILYEGQVPKSYMKAKCPVGSGDLSRRTQRPSRVESLGVPLGAPLGAPRAGRGGGGGGELGLKLAHCEQGRGAAEQLRTGAQLGLGLGGLGLLEKHPCPRDPLGRAYAH